MAIGTYSELQTAVQNWLDDTNTFTTARCQEFIALCEADLGRRLRVRDNLTLQTGTAVTSQATIDLPARFGGVQSLSIASGGYYQPIAQMGANAAQEAYYGYGTGMPRHYTLEATFIRLYPTPDTDYAYSLLYWQKINPLTDANTTNWLLTSHPDVYLFGSLAHAEGFRVNDARLAAWRAQYEAALAAVQAQGYADDIGGRSFSYVQGGTP